MDEQRIAIRVARALCFMGNAMKPGQVLDVSPLQAIELVCSGRAVLKDPADQAALDAAARRHELACAKAVHWTGHRPMGPGSYLLPK